MTDGLAVNHPSDQGGSNESYDDYLARAVRACEAGDRVLGMYLYLAAYEKAAIDPNIPDGMALTGLNEAWNLACELKERSMAEYVFEKLEPYLTGEEIAQCANKLQDLALDRLEEYGFSREELQDMAEMISQDLMAADGSVVKVESITLPTAGLIGGVEAHSDDTEEFRASKVEVGDVRVSSYGESESPTDQAPSIGQSVPTTAAKKKGADRELGMGLAPVDDFNPYDMYDQDISGTSFYAATAAGSGWDPATQTDERSRARAARENREKAVSSESVDKLQADQDVTESDKELRSTAADQPVTTSQPASSSMSDQSAVEQPVSPEPSPESLFETSTAHTAIESAEAKSAVQSVVPAPVSEPSLGQVMTSYRTLVGYDQAISIMRDFGIGLHRDPGFLNFVSMMNQRHGVDGIPSVDTLLFRAPAIEDAARFVEATIGEIGLPVLRMSMEENMQGMPMLCVTVQGNNRPRMNHAHNRFEGPGILVIDDLDMWAIPELPEGVEGFGNLMMANISRGAREAVNLIRSAIEDPDVYVLATATTLGDVDPFFYEMLEPMTVIEISNPDEAERYAIWAEILREHPSMRTLDKGELVRFSTGMARYDIYMAAREAVEEAYKIGIARHTFVPVTPQNMYDKLAVCQPLDSEEYQTIEDELVRWFRNDLDNLEGLLGE